MKPKELQQKSVEDLKSLLNEKRAKLSELKFMLAQKKIKNIKELGQTRKDIARILTILKP